ncbi:MAG: L-glutamate gamma-semialdehyde dehydrogenase [Anaerolineaceae bacterium]|nr:L-glutamate gamma-semialdehyde dehydrogenase [Anaerolineaceae bacterium]MDE0329157.1 L-glutamate gamma-semialdehyde dehydrogenase [Anaerolineaceae bacterium]
MLTEFRNEPVLDYSNPEDIKEFRAALERLRAEAGQTLPLVIGGEKIYLDETFATVCPARPDEVLAHFADGGVEHVDMAVAAAEEAFASWRLTPVGERARLLLRVAALMRVRRHELNALMSLEIGKAWAEADGETSEAIDFLEYYARQMLDLADRSDELTEWPGEQQTLNYIPLGVGAVIPPWNFPLAIGTGLLSATLVAGNAAVYKPAEQSPLLGWKVAEYFLECGLPAGVMNFVTGPGEVVGARMVEHPRTRFICFTGSRDVGVEIYEKAGRVLPGQPWLKRSILEMGGKDAVLVDETARLDQAAEGIVTSAFGYQGQKCSAGSRVIIVDDVYDELVPRILERAKSLRVGAPDKGPDVTVGPVIDPNQFDKVKSYLEAGSDEGEVLLGGSPIETDEGGYFIQPTIFGEVPESARIAQEEIFGPVVALVRARDFEDALRIVNSTDYGLTGAVYSEDPGRLSRVRDDFHVGNLYINRKCTGAMVGVQPFGGFNMSGTDSKAGGPDYLTLFTQAKTIAQKL